MNSPLRNTRSSDSVPLPDFGVEYWLDALEAGACSQDEFVWEVQALEAETPHARQQAVAMLDQYHRQRRISQRVFSLLQERLQTPHGELPQTVPHVHVLRGRMVGVALTAALLAGAVYLLLSVEDPGASIVNVPQVLPSTIAAGS